MSKPRGRGSVRIEDGPKRVRAMLGGELLADTTNVKLVWEKPYYPTYYFPVTDVKADALVETDRTEHSPSRGVAVLYDVKVGDTRAEDAAWSYPASPIEELAGLVAFDWSAMDHWFEEDEEVFVHPRDPYTRIDILDSSRHIEVVVDGTTVAESDHAKLLFETGLPTRYYVPKVDVRMDLLVPSSTNSECPYKGTAEYWTVTVDGSTHHEVAWSYRSPVHESSRIAGLISFYNERVDIYVDGVLETRPRTVFS